MDLRTLQLNLPWTIKYSRDFRANPQPHKDFAHALIHAGKALGKLFAFADDMDHDRDAALQASPTASARYLADLVICAMRACNTYPGTVIDLEAATIERLESKNGTRIARPATVGEDSDPPEPRRIAEWAEDQLCAARQRANNLERRIENLEREATDAQAEIDRRAETISKWQAMHDGDIMKERAIADERGRKIDALEKQLDDERAARVTHHEALEGLAEQLHTADADRVPLRMDLDEARKTIARMQPLCDAAQRGMAAWRESPIETRADLPLHVIASISALDDAELSYVASRSNP